MIGDTAFVEIEQVEVMPPSHSRILVIMAVLGVLGAVVGGVLISPSFGLGILFGIGLSFVNYYWLKHSLQRVFNEAVEGEKAKVSALRYILRYVTLAAITAVGFVTDVLPVVAVILGLGTFGFAVVVDGTIRIFSGSAASGGS